MTSGIKLTLNRRSDKGGSMKQKREVKSTDQQRRTVRRSADYKARLSAASSLLAEKMEEKRNEWALK